MSEVAPQPKKRSLAKTLTLNFIKLAIAVGGLWWVITHTPWNDIATIRDGAVHRNVTFRQNVDVTVIEPKQTATQPATTSAPRYLDIRFGEQKVKVQLPESDTVIETVINEQTVNIPNETPMKIADFVPVEDSTEPKIQIGLRNLIKDARPKLLLASAALLLIPFLVSAWRWRLLLTAQNIHLPFSKTLTLTFVGQFYSTFLPGITGGDLVKIIYTARLTGSKTKSAVTIILDRIIGLIALVVIAGIAAAFQSRHNPMMLWVAIGIALSLAALVLFSVVYFSQRLRQKTGLEWLLTHSRMPGVVQKFDDALSAYRGAWRILAMAFAASLVTQIVVPLSAYLAGKAFGIQAHPGVYLSYVPLAILAASVPLSPPQGFGVTEWVLFKLFAKTGVATASQTFALAQAIRFLPILWNLIGAYWVVTGSYSRKQAAAEEKTLTA